MQALSQTSAGVISLGCGKEQKKMKPFSDDLGDHQVQRVGLGEEIEDKPGQMGTRKTHM